MGGVAYPGVGLGGRGARPTRKCSGLALCASVKLLWLFYFRALV